MRELTLVITDFALPGDGDAPIPRLPALERLLARGEQRESRVGDWRQWVLAAAGMRWQGPLALAATIAGRPGHWALATPVHLLAGLERVHLDPTGLPRLSEAEQRTLSVDFNGEFGAEGHALSFEDGAALLGLPEPIEATCHDPHSLPGAEAGAWMPSGPGGARLRRLMTEIQMWLHGHALNAQRAARGAPPVNALWIWGLGEPSPLKCPDRLPRLASADPFLRAVWRRSGGRLEHALSRLAHCGAAERPEPVIATAELAGAGESHAQALELAETHWFAPLEAALAAGRIDAARLLLAGREMILRRRDRVRFWRRRRAWAEALA